METITGGEAVVRALIEENVKIVFGIAGIHVLHLYDALAKHQEEIRHVLPVHEQGGTFMADAYGRVTGEPGVIITTAGPGATNTVTAVAQAYVEGAPLVLISGAVPVSTFGKGYFHEFTHLDDQLSIFKPITKFAARAESIDAIPEIISQAFAAAREGKRGPAYVEIPIDVMESSGAWNGYKPRLTAVYPPEKKQVDEAARLLREAKKPVIYAGGGVIAANASEELVKLAETLSAPVVMSVMGKGSIPTSHPLHAGLGNGNFGDPKATEIMAESDVMLAVGTRFDELGTGRWTLAVPEKLIHVSIDESVFNRTYRAALAIKSDAKLFLGALLEALAGDGKREQAEGAQRIQSCSAEDVDELGYDAEKINYSDVVAALSELITENTIVTCDAGWNQLAMFQIPVYKPRHCFSPAGYNSMGYALPAAIGAKLAAPNATVIATTGDAGFMMTAMELATAVREKAPIAVILMNDTKHGVLRSHQRLFYDGRTFETDSHILDFAKFAEAMGVPSVKIEQRDEIKKGLADALKKSKTMPVVVEIAIAQDVLPRPTSRYACRGEF